MDLFDRIFQYLYTSLCIFFTSYQIFHTRVLSCFLPNTARIEKGEIFTLEFYLGKKNNSIGRMEYLFGEDIKIDRNPKTILNLGLNLDKISE